MLVPGLHRECSFLRPLDDAVIVRLVAQFAFSFQPVVHVMTVFGAALPVPFICAVPNPVFVYSWRVIARGVALDCLDDVCTLSAFLPLLHHRIPSFGHQRVTHSGSVTVWRTPHKRPVQPADEMVSWAPCPRIKVCTETTGRASLNSCQWSAELLDHFGTASMLGV
jgi:hypothetical protein